MIENEKTIIEAWEQNGIQWIETIENQEIKSRTQATNQAIVDAIFSYKPQNVLDMGCGEGWICRKLLESNIRCMGVDGVSDLIDYASDKGEGNYIVASYEDLTRGRVHIVDTFDLIVFNYSLFGKQNTYDILEYVATLLKPNGTILIQTIHPKNDSISDHDTSRWVLEDWNGLDPDYTPFEWYFRTEEDWIKVFEHTGLFLKKEENILLPETTSPFSIIYHVKKK